MARQERGRFEPRGPTFFFFGSSERQLSFFKQSVQSERGSPSFLFRLTAAEQFNRYQQTTKRTSGKRKNEKRRKKARKGFRAFRVSRPDETQKKSENREATLKGQKNSLFFFP